MPANRRVAIVLFLAAGGTMAQSEPTPLAPRDDLGRAIAEMRRLPMKLEGEEATQRGPRIQQAWETLIAAKDAGVDALLAEARQLDRTGERDDRFRLGAGSVVWQIGGLARVDDILALWSDADFAVKYSYAFTVAGQASHSKDPRALPLMVALLRDQRGEFDLSQHAMTIGWPATHMMLWAPLGRDAAPALMKQLATPSDPTTVASCAFLLADFWHVDALPQLRKLAREGEGPARRQALWSIGRFGHPDDHDWLVAGLTAADVELAAAHATAVAAFGDLRAVPQLLVQTKHSDEGVRTAAMFALTALPTLEGIDAVITWLGTADGPTAEVIGFRLYELFGDEAEPEAHDQLPIEQRRQRIARARARQTEALRAQADDRKLSRDELRELCAAAIEDGRIAQRFEWVEARHLIAAATAEDVPLLLDARGGLYRRFSDEQIETIERLDQVLEWLVRSRYRAEPGVCEQVRRPPADRGSK